MNQFDRFTPEAKRVLRSAQRIADEMESAIGTEHILLALAGLSENIVSDILRNNDVSVDRIHLAISLARLNKSAIDSGLSPDTKKIT